MVTCKTDTTNFESRLNVLTKDFQKVARSLNWDGAMLHQTDVWDVFHRKACWVLLSGRKRLMSMSTYSNDPKLWSRGSRNVSQLLCASAIWFKLQFGSQVRDKCKVCALEVHKTQQARANNKDGILNIGCNTFCTISSLCESNHKSYLYNCKAEIGGLVFSHVFAHERTVLCPWAPQMALRDNRWKARSG